MEDDLKFMGDNLKMEEHNLVKWHLMGPFDPSTQQ
jgi:hypothetical protein